MRLVTPISYRPLLEYEDGFSVKKGNFAHATAWCWNYQTLESEKKRKTYVCSKIDRQKTASEIVKSVNLLIAIQWGKQAWVSINCRLLLVISSLPLIRTSRIYFLLKIHKPNNPGRPIVPACSCPTELISILLGKIVAPGQIFTVIH